MQWYFIVGQSWNIGIKTKDANIHQLIHPLPTHTYAHTLTHTPAVVAVVLVAPLTVCWWPEENMNVCEFSVPSLSSVPSTTLNTHKQKSTLLLSQSPSCTSEQMSIKILYLWMFFKCTHVWVCTHLGLRFARSGFVTVVCWMWSFLLVWWSFFCLCVFCLVPLLR